MMQHPCQLRFLFTRDTDTSLYTALKIGRSETGREKRVTPEFGEYWRRKIIPLKFRALQPARGTTHLIVSGLARHERNVVLGP
jgi:hypothetical protein